MVDPRIWQVRSLLVVGSTTSNAAVPPLGGFSSWAENGLVDGLRNGLTDELRDIF